MEQQVRTAVTRIMPGVRADLERLVRVPSVGFPGFDPAELERSAAIVVELCRGVGLPDARIVRAGGQPAVIASRPAPPGAPTVMLYAHHDVQPAGEATQWETDPFEPVERDGRLFGRGTADDKAGIMAHIAALRALGDGLPVGVVMLVEGEEETGSDSLPRLLHDHCRDRSIEVIVLADSANFAVGRPALTTGLRGLVNAFVEVRTLDHTVHSGFFGGPVPDALTALCRLLATLHDETGDVAVKGLVSARAPELDYPVQRLRAESGMLDGVKLTGTGQIAERLWTRPSIAVLGVDAPAADTAPTALVPSARAKVSLRIAPGDSAERAYQALVRHCSDHAPWGAQVSVTPEHFAEPCSIEARGPAFEAARRALTAAWDGTAPVTIGIGGAIPFVKTFQEMFPGAAILVTGVEDPDTRAHGPNESLHLEEFERVCLAEALLLAGLGSLPGPGRRSDT